MLKLAAAILALCAGAPLPATGAEVGEAEARAALEESAWAFVHWTSAAAVAAEAFGVAAPKTRTSYVYGGDDGLLNLSATADASRVSLRLEGSGWRARGREAETILTRNAAHEIAHVYQYAVGAALEAQWLHEGFADAMAREMLADRGDANGWGGGLRCAETLGAGPIDAAQAAGDPNALYDCSSLAIRAVAAAREQSVRDFYTDFQAAGGTDAAFLDLAGEANPRHRRSVTAFLTRDWRHADPAWVIRQLRAGRL